MSATFKDISLLQHWPSRLLTSSINLFGLDDARLSPTDWSFDRNPFWTSFLLTLVTFPCLFYLTWYLNPSLSKNRLGLSWVMGFYSAILFTLAGLYEAPHVRTVFNSLVDYHSVSSSTIDASTFNLQSIDSFDPTRNICYPILKMGSLALMSSLPSFLRLEPDSYGKYFCFSDFDKSTSSRDTLNSATGPSIKGPFGPINNQAENTVDNLSLRHRVYQGQMNRPHLFFSLENYPDDGRIGPHIIAANFQAFLVVDLILGFIHYRKQLEPFSTVVHHIIYYFIVVHMRAGDMLSVFCICGTCIEASSIFLAFGRMFPHRRTPTVERLYLTCFVLTRLIYVALLWHEIYFNYPDKSVSFLYTITLSLHIYWFVLYIKTQRKFHAKQRCQHLYDALQNLACIAKEEFTASLEAKKDKSSCVALKDLLMIRSDQLSESENRFSVEMDEIELEMPHFSWRSSFHGKAQVL
ncbi:hypothetical protein BGZ49_000740 [Haplosporangium sp. Z 27]|nr:hypothetical protein BGZ49_000740 [Haplosporangium sp. Z 27]